MSRQWEGGAKNGKEGMEIILKASGYVLVYIRKLYPATD